MRMKCPCGFVFGASEEDIRRVGCGGVAQVDFPSTLSFMTMNTR